MTASGGALLDTIAPDLPGELTSRLHLTDVAIERGDGLPVDDETRAALLGSFDRDQALAELRAERERIRRAAIAAAAELAIEELADRGPLSTAHNHELLDLDTREGLAEAWRRMGHDERQAYVQLLIDRGIRPAAGGMPTGVSGMGFQHNLPEPGSFVENSQLFYEQTERNDIPGPTQAYPGLGGGGVDVRIPQVGVLAEINIVATLSLVVSGTGAVTATYQWPWNTIKRGALNVNGQTGIISAEGMDLRARTQRVYHNTREQIATAPAMDVTAAAYAAGYSPVGDPAPGVIANGTYAVTLHWSIPITHDDYNLIGALYAQSDSNAFFWRFEAGAQSDLFTVAAGGAVTLTGNLGWIYTIYDIPEGDSQNGRVVLLPSMQWLHGFLGYNTPYNNTGEVPVALIRTAGQLLCTYLYLDNGGAAVIDPSALTELREQYGGNRRRRVYGGLNGPLALLLKNQHDYNGRVIKPAGYVLFDNEVDNAVRDLIYPKGVTELQIVATIATGTTINQNAHAHAVEETMFPGR